MQKVANMELTCWKNWYLGFFSGAKKVASLKKNKKKSGWAVSKTLEVMFSDVKKIAIFCRLRKKHKV